MILHFNGYSFIPKYLPKPRISLTPDSEIFMGWYRCHSPGTAIGYGRSPEKAYDDWVTKYVNQT